MRRRASPDLDLLPGGRFSVPLPPRADGGVRELLARAVSLLSSREEPCVIVEYRSVRERRLLMAESSGAAAVVRDVEPRVPPPAELLPDLLPLLFAPLVGRSGGEPLRERLSSVLHSALRSVLRVEGVEAVLFSDGGFISGESISHDLWKFDPGAEMRAAAARAAADMLSSGRPFSSLPGVVVFRGGKPRRVRLAGGRLLRGAPAGGFLVVLYSLPALAPALSDWLSRAVSALSSFLLAARRGLRADSAEALLDALHRCLPADITVFRRVRGSRKPEGLTLHPLRLPPPDSPTWHEMEKKSPRIAAEVLRRGIPISRVFTRADSDEYFDVRFEPFTDADGETKVLRVVRDATHTAKEIRHRRIQSFVIEKFPEGVLIFDSDGKLRLVNKTAREMLQGNIPSRIRLPRRPKRDMWERLLPALAESCGCVVLDSPQEGRIFFRRGDRTIAVTYSSPRFESDTYYILILSDVTAEMEEAARSRNARETLYGVPDAVVFLDRELRITAFNPAASTLLGLMDDQTGRRFDDLFEIFAAETGGMADMARVAREGVSWSGSGTLVVPEAGVRYVLIHVVATTGGTGEVSGYALVLSDVTENVKNTQVRVSLQHFAEMLAAREPSVEAIGRVVSSLENLFGVWKAAVYDVLSPLPCVHPSTLPVFPRLEGGGNLPLAESKVLEDPDAVRSLFFSVFDEEETLLPPPDLMAPLPASAGSAGLLMFWRSALPAGPDLLDEPTVLAICASLGAYIERARAAAARREERKLLGSVMDLTDTAMVLFDRLGTVRYGNEAFRRAFSPSGGAANVLYDEVIASRRDLLEDGLWRRILKGGSCDVQAEVNTAGKGRRTWRWTITPLERDPALSGKPTLFLASGRDVTDLLAVFERAAEADAAAEVQRVVREVSHVFNNSLTALHASLTELERLVLSLPDGARHLEALRRSALKMETLLKRLISFSARGPANRTDVVFDEAVEEVVRDMRSDFPSVRFGTRLSCDRRTLPVDRKQLKAMLAELMRNAAESAGEGGNVTVSTSWKPASSASGEIHGAFVVRVCDDGPGFTPEAARHAFDFFFTTRTPPEGMPRGLGLTIARHLARINDGDVRIVEESEGGCVELVLRALRGRDTAVISSRSAFSPAPRRGIPAAPKPPPAPPSHAGHSSPLLVVLDDDPGVLASLRRMFAEIGIEAEFFDDPEAAYERIASRMEDVSALVLDYNLGDTDAAAFLERLTAAGWDRPVYLCTAYGETAMDAGLPNVVGVIDKPFREDELRKRLRLFIRTEPSREEEETP